LYLWRELIKSSCHGKEEGEDGLTNDASQSVMQFQKQSPESIFWGISEDMGLIKNENDERMPWLFTYIQFAIWIYKFTKFFPSLFNPPIAWKTVPGRAMLRVGCLDIVYIAF